MGVRRAWAFVAAVASVLLFVVGLVVALAPPSPDCGETQSVYCMEAAYDRLRAVILGSWIGAVALLGGAAGLLVLDRKAPPAPRPHERPAPATTADGRRVVDARRPAQEPPLQRTR